MRSNILRPGLDFQDDFGVVTVSVLGHDGTKITWAPLVVTSDRRMFFAKDGLVSTGHGVYIFSSEPIALPSLARWRNYDIERFRKGERVEPTALFHCVRSLHLKYLDYPIPGMAETLALWGIGTYLHPLFPAYPYVELNALTTSGKSKQLSLTAQFAFNGRTIVDPTEASTYRLIENTRGTIGFDEAEKFHKDQKSALLQILNAGYTAGSTVIRSAAGGRSFHEFDLYGPKMFASIRGIDPITATRCIRVQLLRTTDKERGDREITKDGEPWAEIRHRLYSFALTEFPRIREIHRGNTVRPFSNRDNQKWSPILALAVYFEQCGVAGLVETVTQFARTTVGESIENGLPPFDEAVLSTLHKLTQLESAIDISPQQLLDRVRNDTGENWPRQNAQSTGFTLKRLGFTREHSRKKGSFYHVTREQVLGVAARFQVPNGDGAGHGN